MNHDNKTTPSYGVIDHYLGEKGRSYFDWQGKPGIDQALYNKHLWQPYVSADDEIMDFGCGGGFLLKVLDARKKIGVEVNPYARAHAQNLDIETYTMIDQVPGKFDKVLSCHALEHIPHPRQVLIELKEKLRDGNSRLLMLLPLDDWRSRGQKHYNSSDENMHLCTWTPQSLGNLLKSCDMKVLDVRVICHAWPPKPDKLWKLSHSIFHVAAYVFSSLAKQRQLFVIASIN